MATAYANPVEAPAFLEEDGKFDHAAYDQRCRDYEAATLNYIKTELRGKHRLAGEIIALPVADGAAQYMIWTPTKWIHLDEVDGYHADPATIRGYRAQDVIERLDRTPLFGRV
jgi:hypothetical protein